MRRPESTAKSFCAYTCEGAPFHPQGESPRAPCPLCVINNQDLTPKILYAIRGTAKGEFDHSIPAEYLQVPPPQLGHSGNEAIRVRQPLNSEPTSQAHGFPVSVCLTSSFCVQGARKAPCLGTRTEYVERPRKLYRGLSCHHGATQPVGSPNLVEDMGL